MSRILRADFYNQKTLKVAQDLLGCFLVRAVERSTGKLPALKRYIIVETEAYNGPRDRASHASRGKTERNAPMFGLPGTIYVYFTYGMHYMFNIVTERAEYPAAVLIRAVEPIAGANVAGRKSGRARTDGPARLTRALRIDKRFNGRMITTKKHGLWIESRDSAVGQSRIIRAKRVGVDYSGKFKDKKWRYYLKNSAFISKK